MFGKIWLLQSLLIPDYIKLRFIIFVIIRYIYIHDN